MPRMVNLEYMLGEGPNPFPELGWVGGTLEARTFHESSGGFADPISDDDGGVWSMSLEQAYAKHELQENQAAVAVGDLRAVAQPAAGVVLWGLRGGGPEPGPLQHRAEQGAARR